MPGKRRHRPPRPGCRSASSGSWRQNCHARRTRQRSSFLDRCHHPALGRAGLDAVHTDALLPPIHRRCPRQAKNGVLAGDIGAQAPLIRDDLAHRADSAPTISAAAMASPPGGQQTGGGRADRTSRAGHEGDLAGHEVGDLPALFCQPSSASWRRVSGRPPDARNEGKRRIGWNGSCPGGGIGEEVRR